MNSSIAEIIHYSSVIAGELITAIVLAIIMFAMLTYKEHRKSSLYLFLAIAVEFLFLLGDAASFYNLSIKTLPVWLVSVTYFLSYVFGHLIMIPFCLYSKAYIEEKTTVKKRAYLVPVLLSFVSILIAIAAIASGSVYGIVDGKMSEIDGLPRITGLLQIIAALYLPVVAFAKREYIGLKAVLLLGFFGIVPIVLYFIIYDYAGFAAGLALIIVYVLLQCDISKEKELHNKELANLNYELEEQQAQLEEATAEQEAQLEEIQTLFTQKEYLSHSCKMVYSEVYIVKLKDNTYCELDIDGFSVGNGEGGDYLAAIEDHIKYGRIHLDEADKIRKFLSPENIYNGLSENKSIEMRYYRTLKDGRAQWCLTTFVACEMEEGHPTVALMLIKNIDDIIKEEERQKAFLNEKVNEISTLSERLLDNKILLEKSLEEQEAQLEEITAINGQLHENQIQLESAIEDAKAANKAKSDFLSRMSHDIRTPMNVIVGMTEIAKRHFGDPDKVSDCLHKINMESVHLQTLINDVLDISAIESGKLTIRKEEVRVKDIIENMNVSMASLVNSKSIDYVFEQGNLFFPYLNTDNLRISQLYLNLLSNAVKYTPAGGRVKFEIWQALSETKNTVDLHARISDTGMGMSEDFMKNMYTEFARAVDTRINKIQGTGLGLAIVKQITDLMGGKIEVQSELNHGTTFHVVLPVEIIEKTDVKKKMLEEDFDYEDVKGLKVLIAEDNDLNYEIAYELLSEYGMEISRAEDGAVALDVIDSSEPGYYDVILMDMQMPVMNGLEATREIRKLNREDAKNMPIIAMTANAFAEDALACREAGMDAHVAKPINTKFLLETIIKLRNKD